MRVKGVDKWLGRLSHAAQILLCCFTAWALFYTVIPLYKVALLEESIARRELELYEKNEELASAKNLFRQLSDEIYKKERGEVVESVIHQGVRECTNFSYLMSEATASLEGKRRYYNALQDTNYSVCLLAVLDGSSASGVLTNVDFSYLKDYLKGVAVKLNGMRDQSIREMATIEARAEKDPSVLAPKGEFEKGLDEAFEELGIKNLTEIDELASAVSRTEFQIFMTHSEEARNKIYLLRSLSWPD